MFDDSLQCVTVIIGVFDRSTGLPVVGVINQPFLYHEEKTGWSGSHIWGVAYGHCFCNSLGTGLSQCSVPVLSKDSASPGNNVVVLSHSETPAVIQALSRFGFTVQYATGAGYKFLCVIEQVACAYVVSKSSTFKWDVCGPHAILCSMGGNVLSLNKAVKQLPFHSQVVQYKCPDVKGLSAGQKWRNEGGVFAFQSSHTLQAVIDAVQEVVG